VDCRQEGDDLAVLKLHSVYGSPIHGEDGSQMDGGVFQSLWDPLTDLSASSSIPSSNTCKLMLKAIFFYAFIDFRLFVSFEDERARGSGADDDASRLWRVVIAMI
jgi:hypothetical protein